MYCAWSPQWFFLTWPKPEVESHFNIWEEQKECEPSCHPPPKAVHCWGEVREVLAWKHCRLRTTSNELWTPSSPILLLLPSPSLPNPYLQHKSLSESPCLWNLEGARSKGQRGIPGSSVRRTLLSSSAYDTSSNTASLGDETDKAWGLQCSAKCTGSPAAIFAWKLPKHFGCWQELVPLQTDLTSNVKGKLNLVTGQAQVKDGRVHPAEKCFW